MVLSISCQTADPLDPDHPISIEITNVPGANTGWAGLAGVHLAGEPGSLEDPMLGMTVLSNNYAGVLTYNYTGLDFTFKDVRRSARYMVIFVMTNDGETVTRYSKQFTIKSDVIKLDFNSDFFDNPGQALRSFL